MGNGDHLLLSAVVATENQFGFLIAGLADPLGPLLPKSVEPIHNRF